MSSHESHIHESHDDLADVEKTTAEVIHRVDEELIKRLHDRFSSEAFHNPHHSFEVDAHSKQVLDRIRQIDPALVAKDDDIIRHTTAYGHDLVINYGSVAEKYIQTPGSDALTKNAAYGNRIRQRGFFPQEVPTVLWSKSRDVTDTSNTDNIDDAHAFTLVEPIGNERASAEETLAIIAEVDPNELVYTAHVKEGIQEATAATFPLVEKTRLPEDLTISVPSQAAYVAAEDGIFSDTHAALHGHEATMSLKDLAPYMLADGTAFRFYQKHVNEKSSLPTIAVAIGDLAYPGILETNEMIDRGNAEYRETRDLVQYELSQGLEKLSDERRTEIVQDMLEWLKTQVQFILWQKVNFEHIISSNEKIQSSPRVAEIQQALRDMYSNFDTNTVSAMTRYAAARAFVEQHHDTYDQLAFMAKEMGYEL